MTPLESVPIGIVGAFLANASAGLLVKLKVDDAVGATGVHGKKDRNSLVLGSGIHRNF